MENCVEVDKYIEMFPEKTQEILRKIRKEIQVSAPETYEKISWAMPTYALKGNLVHFAAFKHHIGFYPGPSAIEYFQDELTNYKTSKGAIQFSLEEEIPYDLIKRIVEYRVRTSK